MHNAFSQACEVEAQSLEVLRPFIQQKALNGQYVLTNKGALARELQKSVGDVLFNGASGEIYGVEIKAESENRTGNFFLEFWSNRKRFAPGWMWSLDTDLLFYYFLDNDELYIINFRKLKRWFWWHDNGQVPNFTRFKTRPQSKYDQLNDTWGTCVPIDVIGREVGFKFFNPQSLEAA